MNRLTRITAILIQLQSKKIVIAKDIANRFEISLRTVYRDIKTLQDAGVPIGSENGKGYFIVDGFHLPPIMITEQEANTLVIAEKLIQNQGDTSLNNDFSSLLYKIKSVLKGFQKDNYDKLENRITPSYIKKPLKSISLSFFQNSILKNQVIKITYNSISKNNITHREIEPLGIYFSNTAWILVAHCRLRLELREFRLDRIIDFKLTTKYFKNIENFNLTEYFIKKYQT